MGEVLYERCCWTSSRRPPCRVYAPVGGHRDLLAYLVRRLLENGANSSFVSVAADPSVPIAAILKRPQSWIGERAARAPSEDPAAARSLRAGAAQFGRRRIRRPREPRRACSTEVRGAAAPTRGRTARRRRSSSPASRGRSVRRSTARRSARCAKATTRSPRPPWRRPRRAFRPGARRRSRRAPPRSNAPAISSKRGAARLIALLQPEGGKTLDDARRGGARGGRFLPLLRGRGAPRARRRSRCRDRPARPTSCAIAGAACSSASARGIFRSRSSSARSSAALAAGNAVVAKPAEQTPLIAAEAVRILHEAGVPASALHLVPGDGKVGAALVADPRVAGVAFTGSTEVARADQPRRSPPRTRRSCR